MRQFIFASHHKLAFGLKDTVDFLTSSCKSIYDLSAYISDDEPDLEVIIADLFSKFDKEDEVVILTDMMGGSVNLKFMPYQSEKVHIIAGANLPLAMSIVLLNEEEKLTTQVIANVVEECKNQIVYINQMNTSIDEDDE